MKRVVTFSKAFIPSVIISAILIGSGLFGYVTKGINYGLDFQGGLIQQVRIAPTALSLSYVGSQSVTVQQSSQSIDLVVTGVGSDNQTYRFPYSRFEIVGDFVREVQTVPGVSVSLESPMLVPLKSLFVDSEASARLSSVPYRFHYIPEGAPLISADEVRQAISAIPSASVQLVGNPADRAFQIRLKDDASDPQASQNLKQTLTSLLVSRWGEPSIAIISTDFVGSRFSASLASQAFWLVGATLLLIWAYCAIRFRWDFAVGGVLAIIHDTLIMVAFIVWTGMPFNSTTVAAILTILGYSINDTVVIFDRIRENIRFHPDKNITWILNHSQTEVLGRTVITTVTTMLAVFSLYFFTTGDMKNFALALLVGMVSGVYSTIFIASAFINFASRFRKDKGVGEEKRAVRASLSGEVV